MPASIACRASAGTRDHGLQAAGPAAGTGGALATHGHMAELAGAAVRAAIQVTPDDDAQSDAPSDGDGDGVVEASAKPVETLGDSERVHVVVHQDGDAQAGPEHGRQREVGPAEHR